MGSPDFVEDLESLPSFKHINFLELFLRPKPVDLDREVGNPAVLILKNLGKALESTFVRLKWPDGCRP